MKKYKVWIDDIRPMPKDFNIHIRTVNAAIAFISKNKNDIELLSLDHDAGDYYPQGGDYIRILDWMEKEKIYIPIEVHSANIVGVTNMMKIYKRLKAFR